MKFSLMLIRESNCHCCDTIWFLPSSQSSTASPLALFARVFPITAPCFSQRTVSLLWKALHSCHQYMPLGCSFAGQWALLPVPQSPASMGVSSCQMQHPVCIDVHLQSQMWSCYVVSDPRQILFRQNYIQYDMYFCLLLLKSPSSSLFVIFPPSEEYCRASQAVG